MKLAPRIVSTLIAAALVSPATADAATSFTAGTAVPPGLPWNSLTRMAAADLNRDGWADVVVTEPNTRRIHVLLGTASGALTTASGSPFVFPGAGQFIALAIADFDRDGKRDLVSGNGSLRSWLRGNGDGRFTPGGTATQDPPLRAIATADFDGDHRADLGLTVLTVQPTDYAIAVMRGDGAGGFTQVAGSPFRTGDDGDGVATGDFDDDGRADIATRTAANTVAVMLGNGDGTLIPAVGSPYPAGITDAYPRSLTASDVDSDGDSDLVIPDPLGHKIAVMLSDGTGRMTQAPGSPIDPRPSPSDWLDPHVAVGDFNADGRPDLAMAYFGTSRLAVWHGDGTGRFTAHPTTWFARDAFEIVTGDLDRDGRLDVALLSPTGVTPMFNRSEPTLSTSPAALTFPTQPTATVSRPSTITLTSTDPVPLRISRVEVAGAAPDDFMLSGVESCTVAPLARNQACQVQVRFAPGAEGTRGATLRIHINATASPREISLTGTGGPLPKGDKGDQGDPGLPGADGANGADGQPGATGDAGAAGATGPTGPQGLPGPSGPQGAQGPQGPPGRDAKVTCKVTKTKSTKRIRVTCSVRLVTATRGRVRVKLVRGDRVYVNRLVPAGSRTIRITPSRRVPRGRYTLIIRGRDGNGGMTTTRQAVRLR